MDLLDEEENEAFSNLADLVRRHEAGRGPEAAKFLIQWRQAEEGAHESG